MHKCIIFILLFLYFSTTHISIAQTSTQQSIVTDPPQYGKPFSKMPDKRDVIVYQVNMRAFSEQGNFKGVIARLDSIKALGINVIYLMPIYPVGIVNTVNSPYCIKDYLAINKEFGSLEDLRSLVNGAHQRNMAIILDWVANHTSFDHVWIKNKSWYLQDSTGNIVSPPGTGWTDVAQLNFKNAAMRLEMIKEMKYWVYSANIDGFRCDFADGPPEDFWKQAIDTLRNISTHQLLFLAEGSKSSNYAAGFDYNFGFKFFGTLKRIYAGKKSVQSIDSLNSTDYNGASNGQQIIRYTTNHDVNSSDGTPQDLFGGQNGSLAAFVVVACMKSVPMIYNGQEVGMTSRLVFPFTTSKVNWTANPGITYDYKKIISFRNANIAVRQGKLTSYSSADICAFTKEKASEKVLVISNLRNTSINFPMPEALINTSWHNAMDGNTIKLEKQLTLQPYSYLLLNKVTL
jgi:glycosidase